MTDRDRAHGGAPSPTEPNQRPPGPGWPDPAPAGRPSLGGPPPAGPAPVAAPGWGTGPAPGRAPQPGPGFGSPPGPAVGPAPGYGPGAGSPPQGPGYGPPPGYGPGAGFAPQGPGHWPSPGFGGYGSRTELRHRPGAGLAIGLVGVALLLLSYVALPWASGGGVDADFSDIRDMYSSSTEYRPTGVGDSRGEGGGPTEVPMPPVAPPTVGLRQQEPVPPPPPTPVPGPGTGPTAVPVTGEDEFMELYVEVFWYGILAMTVVAVVFATWLVPRSRGLRIVIGFLVGGLLGLVINAVDEQGKVAPRLTGAMIAVLCLGVHGYALSILFGDDYSPDPAIGVWTGVAGLIAVLVGCVVGTRTEQVPAMR